MKRLYKSKNKMVSGVCAGIAEYFNVDPTVVRLIFAGCLIVGGSGMLLYIVCACIFPEQEAIHPVEEEYKDIREQNGNN